MFTVPSLRARDCGAKEKDALNVLFIAIPLINVLIPFVWKSFAGVFTADVLLMLGVCIIRKMRAAVWRGRVDGRGAERIRMREKERESFDEPTVDARTTTTVLLFLNN